MKENMTQIKQSVSTFSLRFLEAFEAITRSGIARGLVFSIKAIIFSTVLSPLVIMGSAFVLDHWSEIKNSSGFWNLWFVIFIFSFVIYCFIYRYLWQQPFRRTVRSASDPYANTTPEFNRNLLANTSTSIFLREYEGHRVIRATTSEGMTKRAPE